LKNKQKRIEKGQNIFIFSKLFFSQSHTVWIPDSQTLDPNLDHHLGLFHSDLQRWKAEFNIFYVKKGAA